MLGLLGAATRPGKAAPADVQVLSADPASLRLAIEVPEIRLDPAAVDATARTLSIEGYGSVGRPGAPALPERIVVVAVPPSGAVEVEASATATEQHEALRLAGYPVVARSHERDAGALDMVAAAPQVPPPIRSPARLLDVSWMRNQRIARVAITPAAFDMARGRLTVHHRIELVVRFSTPTPPTPPDHTADPFENIYRETVVNYEQGRGWRRAAASRIDRSGRTLDPGRLPVTGASGVLQAKVVPSASVYAGRRWIKIAIPSTGFYRVDFGQVRNTALFNGDTTTALDSLRLFTWPGVPVLPENSYCDSCDYREVAIGFVENGNQQFSNNRDYLYFFALGPSDWADLYDPVMPETTFVNHPYETRNYVYLTRADAPRPVPGTPRRITAQTGAFVPGDTTTFPPPTSFRERLHFEQEGSEYHPDSSPFGFDTTGTFTRFNIEWEKDFWAVITRGTGGFDETFDLPGLDASQPARMRARVWGLTQMRPGSEKSLGQFDHLLEVSIPVGRPLANLRWDGLGPQTYDSTLTDLVAGGNSLRLQVLPHVDPDPRLRRIDNVGVARFDLFYHRRFEPVNNQLSFESDPGGGSRIYRVGPFTTDQIPHVFDVTDPLAPTEVRDPDYRPLSTLSWELRFRADETGRRRYRIFPDAGSAGFVKPPNTDVVDAPSSSLQNLRGQPYAGGDSTGRPLAVRYLLIYYDGFRAAADSLLRWRVERLPLPGIAAPHDTFSVPISALYDQFSGGRTDPSAIRNFLRAAFFNWSVAPAFVSILGDASRDFKNLTGQARAGQPGALVPSYEGGYDDIVLRQYATDDWLLNVDDPDVVLADFIGGRIPADNAASALGYVRDKLLPYERAAPLGEWHDRVMLIADDNQQGSEPDALGWLHMTQTARLDRLGMPSEIDRAYVYLHTFPLEANSTKPLARSEILENLGEGAVLFNYIGHGGPVQISDEKVFSSNDAEQLTNRIRPSIFVAASCDVGKYNNPTVESLGEKLIRGLNGGAVAVVSATELAFSYQSAALNLEFDQQLFRRDPGTGQYERSVAEALKIAKVTGVRNNQKYQVMGDAAVRPAFPRLWVETSVQDLNGAETTQLPRGSTLELRGQVLDRPGGSPVTLDGLARLLVEDSAPVDTVPDCTIFCGPFGTPSCLEGCSYRFRAAPIFRGDVSVHGGRFQTRFVVPMDAKLGPRGRARGYVELGAGSLVVDGVGSDTLALEPGSPPPEDREGPRIMLSFVGGSTNVRPDALLKVDLADPNGILITGHVPKNGIIVTVDENSSQRYEITSSFRYAANSYQSGTASFRLPGLSAGPHRIRVGAADNLAAGIAAGDHRSSAMIDFEVTDRPTLRVTRALLFPNPVRSGVAGGGGQFVVDAPGDSVNVLLRIYTVSGRAVRTLEYRGGLAQVQIPWDGLDAEGAALARGTYLYKVQVYARDELGRSDGQQRAAAEGKFVVVGR